MEVVRERLHLVREPLDLIAQYLGSVRFHNRIDFSVDLFPENVLCDARLGGHWLVGGG